VSEAGGEVFYLDVWGTKGYHLRIGPVWVEYGRAYRLVIDGGNMVLDPMRPEAAFEQGSTVCGTPIEPATPDNRHGQAQATDRREEACG
jgi:hypothetical protein